MAQAFKLTNGQIITMPEKATIPASQVPSALDMYYGVSPYTVPKATTQTTKTLPGAKTGLAATQQPMATLKPLDTFRNEVNAALSSRVNAGKSKIDTAFAPFTDSFFSGQRQDAFVGGVGDLDRQYAAALRAAPNDRVTSEQLNSSYLSAYGGLNKQANTQSKAQQNQVLQAKKDLYAKNAYNGDPVVADQAKTAASSLNTALKLTSLGDVFQKVLSNVRGGGNV